MAEKWFSIAEGIRTKALAVGVPINVKYSFEKSFYPGTIVKVESKMLHVDRADGMAGGGVGNSWLVGHSAQIQVRINESCISCGKAVSAIICSDCASKKKCSGCKRLPVHEDYPYCVSCLDKHMPVCDECKERTKDFVRTGGHVYCRICATEYTFTCYHCSGVYPTSEENYFNDEEYGDDDPLCPRCYRELNEGVRARESKVSDVRAFKKLLLSGKIAIYKTLNTFAKKDDFTSDIVTKVGEVRYPLRVFGLKDREEYSVFATPDVAGRIAGKSGFIKSPIGKIKIEVGTKKRSSIGFSATLRKEHLDFCVNLVKRASTRKPCEVKKPTEGGERECAG